MNTTTNAEKLKKRKERIQRRRAAMIRVAQRDVDTLYVIIRGGNSPEVKDKVKQAT